MSTARCPLCSSHLRGLGGVIEAALAKLAKAGALKRGANCSGAALANGRQVSRSR